jgi:flagellar biosynthesis regulator FlbT
MPGRNLLVIGSQCESLPRLSFLPDIATELYEALTDRDRGACQPALDPSGLVIDPTVAEAKKAIRTAFERAARDEATLLLAVIGHGEQVTGDGDFYLLPTDAEVPPADDTALNLVSHVKGLRRQYETDGLVVLVDTCYSGTGAVAAGQAWPSMSLGEFRFEFLAATADRPAFDGCFSKSLTQWVRRGMNGAPGDLRCETVRVALAGRCQNQVAQHVSYQSDPGLFLAHNLAPDVVANPAAGTPAADTAERLTAWFQPTGDLERVVEFSQVYSLVAVVGDAGTGKSAIAATLIRPEVAPGIVPPRFAQAVVFASESSTPTQVATDLSGQLDRSVPGFAELAQAFERAASDEEWNGFDALYRQVVGPLTRYEGDPVRIVVDAIDQLPEDSSAPVRTALSALAEMGIRIVVTARPDAWLPERAEQLDLGAAQDAAVGAYLADRGIGASVAREISALASGNWLVVSLLAGLVSASEFDVAGLSASWGSIYDGALSSMGAEDSETWQNRYRPILTILAAAGTGPILPMALLRLASEKLGGPARVGSVRDTLVRLRQLVVRGRPGTPDEQVGLFHATLKDYLSAEQARYAIDIRQGHGAILEAIDELAPRARHDPADPLHRYAAQMEPEHLWGIGDYPGVIASLSARGSVIPVENLRRWTSWAERFTTEVGEDHHETLTARTNTAYWTGQAGDAREALRLFQELLPDSQRVLGADHRDTLVVRNNIAVWTGHGGDPREALRLASELLPDRVRVLGADDSDTLRTRNNIAVLTSDAGDTREALRLSRQLLPDQEQVLGADNPDTLRTRNNIAMFTGQGGDAREALRLFQELLPDQERVLGADNRDILTTRNNIATFTYRSGDASKALRLSQELLPDEERVLGADHPDTLRTRSNIAFCTGETGDPREALRLNRELLPDWERVLGADHPDTLTTRSNIAVVTGNTGDPREGLRLSRELLPDEERVLGADHPDTLRTRNDIATFTGNTGDAREAVRLFRELLPDYERVLGADHPETCTVRTNLATWTARAGDQ